MKVITFFLMAFITPVALAAPTGALSARETPHSQKVKIDDLSGYQCARDCMHEENSYNVESKTLHQFCESDHYEVGMWVFQKVTKCVVRKCPSDQWKVISKDSKGRFKDFCGWSFDDMRRALHVEPINVAESEGPNDELVNVEGRKAPNNQKVNVDNISTFQCVRDCYRYTPDYDVESKTRHQFCESDHYDAAMWGMKKATPCVRNTCPREHWPTINTQSRAWFKDFCGWSYHD